MTSSIFQVIAFDADDTLWHNERLYVHAQNKFVELLTQYHDPKWIRERLDETEGRNLQHFGYGIKSFALSMIETAVELTEGRITGQDIQQLLQLTKELLRAEVELLDHVAETVSELAASYPLMIITKGDLLDQETKLERSGLAQYFQKVEVVSSKTRASYERVLRRHNITPEKFLMIGNSIKSDILPILELGGYAIYVPYYTTWIHEAADPPPSEQPRYYALEHLGLVPELLAQIEDGV